jgi:hypothetical membrane protein
MSDAVDRLSRLAGPAAVAVTLCGVAAAVALSPEFSWTESALSDLGTAPRTAPAFNGALVAGGALGVGFAPALWRRAGGPLGVASTVAFAAAMVAMAGVGLFPMGTALHLPAAVAFYLFATAAMALDGAGARADQRGRAGVGLAAVHLLAWVAWAGGLGAGAGLAVPETVGALLFAGWVWLCSPPARGRQST